MNIEPWRKAKPGCCGGSGGGGEGRRVKARIKTLPTHTFQANVCPCLAPNIPLPIVFTGGICRGRGPALPSPPALWAPLPPAGASSLLLTDQRCAKSPPNTGISLGSRGDNSPSPLLRISCSLPLFLAHPFNSTSNHGRVYFVFKLNHHK